MENIDREDWLRISKSGCSIKLGWQEKRIVASVPHGVVTNCTEQWLEDAQRLCDGWNELPILKAEIKSLRQQLAKPAVEWISVKDRLPDDGQYVQVFTANYGLCTACFTKTEHGVSWWCRGQQTAIHPTHWQPLPNPPAAYHAVQDKKG